MIMVESNIYLTQKINALIIEYLVYDMCKCIPTLTSETFLKRYEILKVILTLDLNKTSSMTCLRVPLIHLMGSLFSLHSVALSQNFPDPDEQQELRNSSITLIDKLINQLPSFAPRLQQVAKKIDEIETITILDDILDEVKAIISDVEKTLLSPELIRVVSCYFPKREDLLEAKIEGLTEKGLLPIGTLDVRKLEKLKAYFQYKELSSVANVNVSSVEQARSSQSTNEVIHSSSKIRIKKRKLLNLKQCNVLFKSSDQFQKNRNSKIPSLTNTPSCSDSEHSSNNLPIIHLTENNKSPLQKVRQISNEKSKPREKGNHNTKWNHNLSATRLRVKSNSISCSPSSKMEDTMKEIVKIDEKINRNVKYKLREIPQLSFSKENNDYSSSSSESITISEHRKSSHRVKYPNVVASPNHPSTSKIERYFNIRKVQVKREPNKSLIKKRSSSDDLSDDTSEHRVINSLKSSLAKVHVRKSLAPMKERSRKFSKKVKRHKWRKNEIKTLLKGITMFGIGNWTAIEEEFEFYKKGRSNVDLKDKWRNLVKCNMVEKIDDNWVLSNSTNCLNKSDIK